jgi:EmrB/QacA subfamily drug resistance transporter
MVFIDSSAVNVALPVLQEGLGATVTDVQWVIEIYTLFLAALILPGGALGDRLGRRRVFLWGVGSFALASLWCGLSPDVEQLIVARAVQGVGGALLVPGSLAIISASFPEETRGRAIGTWSGATAITSAAGPVLGGWLATDLSWRWVFFINIPLAILVIAVSLRHVPESRGREGGRIDVAGAVTSVLALGLLTYALIEAGTLGFAHPVVLAAGVTGLVTLAAFVLVERRSPAPMMPLHLFRSRAFTGANLLTLLLYGALGGALFFVPFNLIQVQRYSPAEAGAAWLPFILIIAGLSRWTGALVPVVGPRALLVAGPLVTAGGFALAARPGVGGSYWTTFFPAFVVMGIGMAVAVAPLVTVVMGTVAEESAGAASGINNAVSRVAGLLAIAAMGLLVLDAFGRTIDDRLAAGGVRPALVSDLRAQHADLAAMRPPREATPGEADAIETAVRESFVSAFRLAMLVASALAALSALVAWVTIDAGAARGREGTSGESRKARDGIGRRAPPLSPPS